MLSSFFRTDPKAQFPYELPQQPDVTVNGTFYAKSFKKGEPSESVTVAWGDGGGLSALKAHAQKLRTMRHPHIVTYIDSVEINNCLYLVTEQSLPLECVLRDEPWTAEQKPLCVGWGIFQIMSGLNFFHEQRLCHSNVRNGVFVTVGLDWKLGGLQHIEQLSNPATDMHQLAILLWEVFNGQRQNVSTPPAPNKIPAQIVGLYKKLAAPSSAHHTFADLLKDSRATGGPLKTKFIDILLFLDEIELKDSPEKQSFFNNLRNHLDMFPDSVAIYKILPRLIRAYEYGDAGPNILTPLFRIGGLLNEEEYQRRIVPCLLKLFGSADRVTRVKLLERIEDIAPHLTPQVTNEKVFSNIVTGFLDTSPAIRESTVKAMVCLAEKLNSHNLNTELLKHLARLQGSDEHGGIRTNTTICVGKIACYIDPSKRQQVLLSAFSRGMKDPFPPARLAAVLALSATQQFISVMEIANSVLPCLSRLTCDPEKQVRDQAFKAIKGFLEKLEKASENPELIPELDSQVSAGGKSLLSADKVPQWASWALKSLSGKFYKGTPPPESNSASATTNTTSSSSPDTKSTLSKDTSDAKENTDGWDDQDDDWADAKDDKSDYGDGLDDWNDSLRSIEKKSKPIGRPLSRTKIVAKETPISTEADGWDVDKDDFGDNFGDWGSSSKTVEEPAKPKLVAKPIAKPKIPIKDRAKPKGALKLTSTVKPEKPLEDDFADW